MPPDSSVPALDGANLVFEAAYGIARAASEVKGPLLVVLASELALHVRGERRSAEFSHPAFHSAKIVAHIAVALFAMTGEAEENRISAETLFRLEAIRSHVRGSLSELSRERPEDDQELRGELAALLELELEFTERALAERRTPAPGRDEFAKASGRRILRATELATSGQIGALHGAFERVIASLSPDEREALQVVVVGDHQARSRSLGMQYFQRRLAEPEGLDDRVTYGENVADEAEAIALVGTRRLDCAIARAFFSDEKRLQRDVLGDAAKRCLDRMQLTPIVQARET